MVDLAQVRTFIGIDAHAGHCTLKAVSREGKEVLACAVPTETEALQAAVESLPKPAWAILEASTMAPYVTWALRPVLERVIACETRENRWIARSEDKSDPRDADRLARLLRMGEFKEVYVPTRAHQEIREVVRLYDKLVHDGTRLKNRIKAKYRQHGVTTTGGAVFTAEGRAVFLRRVKRPTVRFLLKALYENLDVVEETADALFRRLRGLIGHWGISRRLVKVPGIGPVLSPIFVAVIDEPHRFATARKLWKYAGYSVERPWSGQAEKGHARGSKGGHRLLKYAAMMAARHALQGENRFSRHHAAMVERGIDPAMADRTIARQILATVLAMWKNGTDYRDSWPD
jgi:transposase